MKLAAALVLLCWFVAWIEIATEGQESPWTRIVREAKRRAKEML